MIISTPITSDLGLGTNQILEPRDSQVEIPPALLPVVDFIQVLTNPIDSTIVTLGSFLARSTVTRGPSLPLLQTTFARLPKGLWNISTSLYTLSDFAATILVPAIIEILLLYQVGLAHRLNSHFLIIGSKEHQTFHKFLLNTEATLILATPATAAAQNLVAVASVDCSRIL